MNESNETKPAPVLTPAERKALRAQAHHLDPVVMIGEAGLSDAVLAEARRTLAAHTLIKIRVFGDDRALRQSLMQQLCDALGCAPVQMIGKLLVVYRPQDDESDDPSSLGLPLKRRGEHRSKKALGGIVESGPSRARAPAKPRASTRGTPAGSASKTRTSAGSGKSLSPKTAGKRTDLSGAKKIAPKRGQASPNTRGPSRLQGKPGPRTGGSRSRGHGRSD